jgi:AAA ATPase domain
LIYVGTLRMPIGSFPVPVRTGYDQTATVSDYPLSAMADWDYGGAPPPDPADGSALVGRRHRLQTAGEWLLSGGSVLFFGPAGAGKTAALDVVTAAVVQSRVLRYAPAASSTGHPDRPFGALAGLLSTITAAELESVPAARRKVLAAAVSAEPGLLSPVTPAAMRLAVLNLLRVLARDLPLLLIVDDLQWVDEASAEVLRFVAPRVDDLPVQMAAAERVAPDSLPLRRGLCPPPLLVVRMGPVAPPDLASRWLFEPPTE